MPFCKSCGAEVAADKKFCVQCGAPLESSVAPAVPAIPVSPGTSALSSTGSPPVKPKKPSTTMIIGGIMVILVIVVAAYVVGMPMLKANQNSFNGIAPVPTTAVTFPVMTTELPTPSYSTVIPETEPVTETTTLPVQIRDERLEEEYEPIYSLDQKFAFGQKVNFAHDLTRPPLYIRFNLTPTLITRHRLVSIGTNNEHYENTTENSPYAWFEVNVLDAKSGAIIDQQGFGKEYTDITKQSFMVRQTGNYIIEMSGNDVEADIQMLIGTP